MGGPSRDPLSLVRQHLAESSRIKQQVAEQCGPDIVRAAELVAAAFRNGGKLLLCGNGGSAADCQHIAAEFVSVLNREFPRPALPAIALTTDTSFLTASANDFGFQDIFARQVEALGRPGDVLLGISTSGASTNVIAALQRARSQGLRTIVFTGQSGGAMKQLGDVVIRVPSTNTQYVQECHITIGHIVCELVETLVSGER